MRLIAVLFVVLFTSCGVQQGEEPLPSRPAVIEHTVSPDANQNTTRTRVDDHTTSRAPQTCIPEPFTYPPVNLDDVLYIIPMGTLSGEHVAPIDHQYYQNFNNDKPTIDVYSPADGHITSIQHMGSFRGDRQTAPFDDYRLVIDHACGLSSVFIHVQTLSEKLMRAAPAFGKQTYSRISIKAGEVIGWFTKNVDYNVVDPSITIHLTHPESYAWNRERLHIQDPFSYFTPEIRQHLIAKSLRTLPPEGGTIEYDIDGTLQGTWFREGTNGWQGLRLERYWADHLAIVPDAIDPDHIHFSIGTFKGIARQFGVQGNTPHPASVTPASGRITYELVESRYYDGDREWTYRTRPQRLTMRNRGPVQGIALIEMLGQKRIKVEVFPDKTAQDVTGFTSDAGVYVR